MIGVDIRAKRTEEERRGDECCLLLELHLDFAMVEVDVVPQLGYL